MKQGEAVLISQRFCHGFTVYLSEQCDGLGVVFCLLVCQCCLMDKAFLFLLSTALCICFDTQR